MLLSLQVLLSYNEDDDDDDDDEEEEEDDEDDDKPVLPTWAEGALVRYASRTYINHVC
jgi:hypothetical protein